MVAAIPGSAAFAAVLGVLGLDVSALSPSSAQLLGREEELKADAFEAERYQAAAKAADPGIAATIVGEAIGLIRSIEPAGVILERMVAEAEQLLARGPIITGAGAHDLQRPRSEPAGGSRDGF